jgi:hypothetical protein
MKVRLLLPVWSHPAGGVGEEARGTERRVCCWQPALHADNQRRRPARLEPIQLIGRDDLGRNLLSQAAPAYVRNKAVGCYEVAVRRRIGHDQA